QAELEAVVLARVVGGGDHDTGGVVQTGGAVELIGRGQTRVGDDRSPAHRPVDHGLRELRGAQAHVVGDDHRGGVQVVGEGGAERAGDLCGEGLPRTAPHVVGQHDAGQVRAAD